MYYCEAQGLTRFLLSPPPHPTQPQLSIKSKQVYTSPTSTYDTFLESLGQDLSNPPQIPQEGYIEEVTRLSQCLNAKTGFVHFRSVYQPFLY